MFGFFFFFFGVVLESPCTDAIASVLCPRSQPTGAVMSDPTLIMALCCKIHTTNAKENVWNSFFCIVPVRNATAAQMPAPQTAWKGSFVRTS